MENDLPGGKQKIMLSKMCFFLFVQTHLDDFNDKAEGERESGEDERDADDDHQVGAHPLTFLAC